MLKELFKSNIPHGEENRAVTKVVVGIVFVFLISYIIKPLYITDIYYFNGGIMDSIAHSSCGGYFTVSIIVVILPALNSVVNFPLYIGLRKTFRDQFLSMFQ